METGEWRKGWVNAVLEWIRKPAEMLISHSSTDRRNAFRGDSCLRIVTIVTCGRTSPLHVALRIALSLALIFSSTVPLSLADIMRRISYQGYLIDKSNNRPFTGTKTINFRICADSGCTTQLWPSSGTEDQTGISVTNGVYNVQIGSLQSIPAGLFNRTTAYLEVGIDGTALTPRILMQASPQAFKALMAESLGATDVNWSTYSASGFDLAVPLRISTLKDLNDSNFFDGPSATSCNAGDFMTGFSDESGTFACSTPSPSSGGGWEDTGSVVRLLAGTDNVLIQSTATIGGNAFSVGGSTLVVTAGNVGIGTASPNERLSVSGTSNDVNTPIARITSSDSQVPLYFTSGTGDAYIKGDSGGNFAMGAEGFIAYEAGGFGAANEKMRISSSGNVGISSSTPQNLLVVGSGAGVLNVQSGGNVGIGTALPNGKLDVRGNIYNNNSGTLTNLQLDSDSAQSIQAEFRRAGSQVWGFRRGINGAADDFNLYNFGLAAPAIFARFTDSNIGIGTTNPGSKLDVIGAASFGDLPTKSTFTIGGALNLASGAGITVAGGAELTGLPATPSGATASASKAYVDSQVTAGSGWTDDGTVVRLTTAGDNAVVQSTLTVQGNAFSVGGSTLSVRSGNIIMGSANARGRLSVNPNNTTAVSIYTEGTSRDFGWNASENLQFGTWDGTTWTDRLTITSAGNVGISSNTPQNLLVVGSGGGVLNVQSGGNVGIGTTNPGQKLHVLGGDVQIERAGADEPLLQWYRSGAGVDNKYWRAYATAANDFRIETVNDAYSAAATAINIERSGNSIVDVSFPNGNVGIGDTSPAALLTVGSGDLFQVISTGEVRGIAGSVGAPSYSFTGDPDTGVFSSAANVIGFSAGGTQRLTISTTNVSSTLPY
ncbi:MAG: hypothetical protein HY402_03085, partial [Elusimicrobia bacterium]|nr:hypothetical protein [Elusimicrobiota bacterium]